ARRSPSLRRASARDRAGTERLGQLEATALEASGNTHDSCTLRSWAVAPRQGGGRGTKTSFCDTLQ
ncbi:rCG61452, partial [Rattus norvegicus]